MCRVKYSIWGRVMDRGIIFVFVLLFSVMISACDPPATFTEPQPTEINKLTKIPKKLTGDYIRYNDSLEFYVTERTIIQHYEISVIKNKTEIDSNEIIKGDSIINTLTNERHYIRHIADSIEIRDSYVDTLFDISRGDVIKKYKGLYFISHQIGEGAWEVNSLELSKGILSIGYVRTLTDIERLKQITNNTDTVAPYNFKLTKKQFKEYIKKESFEDKDLYIKK